MILQYVYTVCPDQIKLIHISISLSFLLVIPPCLDSSSSRLPVIYEIDTRLLGTVVAPVFSRAPEVNSFHLCLPVSHATYLNPPSPCHSKALVIPLLHSDPLGFNFDT